MSPQKLQKQMAAAGAKDFTDQQSFIDILDSLTNPAGTPANSPPHPPSNALKFSVPGTGRSKFLYINLTHFAENDNS